MYGTQVHILTRLADVRRCSEAHQHVQQSVMVLAWGSAKLLTTQKYLSTLPCRKPMIKDIGPSQAKMGPQDLNHQIIHQSSTWKTTHATKHSEYSKYLNTAFPMPHSSTKTTNITTVQNGDYSPLGQPQIRLPPPLPHHPLDFHTNLLSQYLFPLQIALKRLPSSSERRRHPTQHYVLPHRFHLRPVINLHTSPHRPRRANP